MIRSPTTPMCSFISDQPRRARGVATLRPLDFGRAARPNGPMRSSGHDLDAVRATLLVEIETLRGSSTSTADKRMPVTLDQQSVGRLSRMDALQGQAMAKAEEERRQQRLRLIDAALQRIDEGDYGYCVWCGDDIPAKRLAFDPAAAQCVDCAN